MARKLPASLRKYQFKKKGSARSQVKGKGSGNSHVSQIKKGMGGY